MFFLLMCLQWWWISLTCRGFYIKYDTFLESFSNELTYKTERNSQKTNLRLLGEGIVRVSGKVMYTLLYSKSITSKELYYSTWDSTRCCVAAWMGRGLGEHGYMCMYGWVPTLFTWNYHNIVNLLRPSTK